MRPTNEKLKQAILDAGKQEFSTQGYQKASMRSIAKSAGATTGAVYIYFTDKQALFHALVSEAAEQLKAQYKEQQRQFWDLDVNRQIENLDQLAKQDQNWLIEYVYDHFEAFKLICCCSAGTVYENYIDQLVQIEVEASLTFIEGLQAERGKSLRIDKELIHIVSNALFSGIFETVIHDMPREKAREYIERLYVFYEAGWFKLLEIEL
ncbi:TetR/AcrR family transcriptional regulator [Lacrimispora sp.]|uniref:TetR/AcrR family transcriptional regulator n=1 Tax=Lacrimispora sp. TaxID=2719234 RepID=UPI0028A615BE|nr:TetR/AcrR family transcriptional regulator [Lacrimispora sp.]